MTTLHQRFQSKGKEAVLKRILMKPVQRQTCSGRVRLLQHLLQLLFPSINNIVASADVYACMFHLQRSSVHRLACYPKTLPQLTDCDNTQVVDKNSDCFPPQTRDERDMNEAQTSRSLWLFGHLFVFKHLIQDRLGNVSYSAPQSPTWLD